MLSAHHVTFSQSGDYALVCIKLLIHNFWRTKSRDFNEWHEIQPKWCSEKCIPDYRYLHLHLHMYPSTYTAQNKLVSICCCWESKVLKQASFVANIWMASVRTIHFTEMLKTAQKQVHENCKTRKVLMPLLHSSCLHFKLLWCVCQLSQPVKQVHWHWQWFEWLPQSVKNRVSTAVPCVVFQKAATDLPTTTTSKWSFGTVTRGRFVSMVQAVGACSLPPCNFYFLVNKIPLPPTEATNELLG